MNIIILQHIEVEDPGYIKDLMNKDKVKNITYPIVDSAGKVIELE